ncbi:hypothetical protein AVEN_263336-1 [Araneus ventricosus]|uniref:Uncharacterized protein n=1 Tax=Araneus ventricosus TaxID=182803 RepID=A0A4Y2D137_ARAVE|nr:hypothetical protein AVEN_263336-1 [Araneus ventricosus]
MTFGIIKRTPLCLSTQVKTELPVPTTADTGTLAERKMPSLGAAHATTSPFFGGTTYHRRLTLRAAPPLLYPRPGPRTCLLTQRLLIDVLVVLPVGQMKFGMLS